MIEGKVVVTRRGEDRLRRGHVWVFRSDVSRVGPVDSGAIVEVANERGRRLGFAFFSDQSEITLRLISREELASDFLQLRLDAAIELRSRIAEGAEACRLVHGEGDGLPSLIVDRYGDYLVIQTLSQATERLKNELVAMLADRLEPRGVLERNDPRVRELEGLERRTGVLSGDVPETIEIREGDARLGVDLHRGQKTGLFLDQRENHRAAREYARGSALDAFAYDGGFALQLAGRADEVLAIDISQDAVRRLEGNARLSGISNIETRVANTFDALRELEKGGRRFDTIVLDPPAFAKSRASVPKARRGYKEINLRALKLLRPGGHLITCSCSYHIDDDDFQAILESAAADARVSMTLVEQRRQARDHPILLGVPETDYLKCLILRKLS